MTTVECILLSTIYGLIIGASTTELILIALDLDKKQFLVPFGVILTALVTYFIFAEWIYPYETRLEYEYSRHIDNKPECMKKTPDKLSCIIEYKEWVADSVDMKNKLDSIKNQAEFEINNIKAEIDSIRR